MDTNERLELLQLLYAGLMAETAAVLAEHGILEHVTERKRREDRLAAQARVEQSAVTTPEALFELHRSVAGFSDWKSAQEGATVTVTSAACKLCDIARASGGPPPCRLFCIDPLTALCAALPEPRTLTVRSTRCSAERCIVHITLTPTTERP